MSWELQLTFAFTFSDHNNNFNFSVSLSIIEPMILIKRTKLSSYVIGLGKLEISFDSKLSFLFPPPRRIRLSWVVGAGSGAG